MRYLVMVLFLISITAMACTTGSTGKDGIPSPSVDVSLFLYDSNQKDLLNPENTPSWDEQSLNLYYSKNGQKDRVFNGMLDNPKRFRISYSEDQNSYYMHLWLSSHLEDGFSTTFIEFPDATMDTLKLKGYRNEHGTIVSEKLWFNDELVWPPAEGESWYLEIIKQVSDG